MRLVVGKENSIMNKFNFELMVFFFIVVNDCGGSLYIVEIRNLLRWMKLVNKNVEWD